MVRNTSFVFYSFTTPSIPESLVSWLWKLQVNHFNFDTNAISLHVTSIKLYILLLSPLLISAVSQFVTEAILLHPVPPGLYIQGQGQAHLKSAPHPIQISIVFYSSLLPVSRPKVGCLYQASSPQIWWRHSHVWSLIVHIIKRNLYCSLRDPVQIHWRTNRYWDMKMLKLCLECLYIN